HLLAADMPEIVATAEWQNHANPLDVNADGFVSPIDALLIANHLNSHGPNPIPSDQSAGPGYYYDVNGDSLIDEDDWNWVVGQLNHSAHASAVTGSAGGEWGDCPTW